MHTRATVHVHPTCGSSLTTVSPARSPTAPLPFSIQMMGQGNVRKLMIDNRAPALINPYMNLGETFNFPPRSAPHRESLPFRLLSPLS